VTQPTTTDPDLVADTATTTTSASMPLVAFQSDPPLLQHPTVLPEGWESCRVLEDASRGDRFCDPQNPDEWVQVAIRYPQTVDSFDSAPSTGDDFDGKWLSSGETNEVAYLRGFTYVSVMSSTVPADTILAIAASIPTVSEFDSLYGDYEVPLELTDVTDQQLAGLLSRFDDEPVVQRRTLEAQVFTPFVSLYGFWGDGFTLPDFASTIDLPRLADAPRPLVVGGSEPRGRVIALWDQGGYGWRLEGRMTFEEAQALAIELMNEIGNFPTM
jgi:hypothetical protein